MNPQTPDASQFRIPSPEESDIELDAVADLYNTPIDQDEIDVQFASITALYDRQAALQEKEPGVDPLVRLAQVSQRIHESRERSLNREFATMGAVRYLARRAMAKGDLVQLRRKELLQQEGSLGAHIWQSHPDLLVDFHHELVQGGGSMKHEWLLTRWLRQQPQEPISFLRYVIEPADQHSVAVRRVLRVKTPTGERSESRLMDSSNPADRDESEQLADAAELYESMVAKLHQSHNI